MDAREVKCRASPDGLPPLLAAMWWDTRGNWDRAHELAQAVGTADGAWVHAYLHRKEGDLGNAEYWYRRAGRRRPSTSLEEEWAAIVEALSSSVLTTPSARGARTSAGILPGGARRREG